MSEEKPKEVNWDQIVQEGPYPQAAYVFVQEGLAFTVKRVHRNAEKKEPGQRHVDGRQLCMGLRDFAVRKYGLLARSVLQHWNITRTEDFGRIVFRMVDLGLMSRTETDTMDDFQGIFSFEESFDPGRMFSMLTASSN